MQRAERAPLHLLLVILIPSMLADCSRPQSQKPTVQTSQTQTEQLPTATEIFNLRSQCAEFGRKLNDSMFHGSAIEQDAVSNYNAKNNRCYVTLTQNPPFAFANTSKWYSHVFLYDGQTQEALAWAKRDGASLDESEKKSGMVFGKNITGYEESQTYIDKVTEREGEKQ